MQLYVPFAKVDILSDDEAIVTGIATDETVDAEGEVTDYEATKEAALEYSNWRNIREMHGPSAVGVAETITLDDPTRSMSIVARVVGKEVVKKIRAGVYKGFSIGGRKLAPPVMESRAGQIIKRIVKYLLTEISLVDRPANPNAIFTFVKRETPMKDKIQKWLAAIRKQEGADETAAEMEETLKAMDEEDKPPAEDTAKAEEVPPEEEEDTAKAEGESTQPPEAEQTPGEPITPETVREIIMAVLMEVGLVQQAEGKEPEVPLDAAYKSMKKSLSSYASADDFKKIIGDVAAVASALETLNTRVEKVEISRSQSGPVLRELGAFIPATLRQAQDANMEKSLIEKMIAETTDPAIKQALGLQLAQAQIKATQGNQINLGR